MKLKLLCFVFILLKIKTSCSLDITSEQLHARILALETKDADQSEFNTRLLSMVDDQREQLKKKEMTIQQLLNQVNILEQRETLKQKEISNLKSRVVVMETKILTLTAETQGQQKNGQTIQNIPVNGLHSNDGSKLLSGFLKAVVEKGSNISNDMDDLVVQTYSNTSTDVTEETSYQEKVSRKIRQTSSAPELVAFHAVSDHGEIPHVGSNQNIVFEKALLNLASGYHAQHGIFIAPVNGLYLFSTSIMADNNGNAVYTELVKNGAVLARLVAHGDNGKYNEGSVTVVTQLNASDEVWVRLYCCADDTLYGGRYTSFTGVMLTAM